MSHPIFSMLVGGDWSFDKVTCRCLDAARMKKVMTSREARYSGLLDKLSFDQCDSLQQWDKEQLAGGSDFYILYMQDSKECVKEAKSFKAALAKDKGGVVKGALLVVGRGKGKDVHSLFEKGGMAGIVTVLEVDQDGDGGEGSTGYGVDLVHQDPKLSAGGDAVQIDDTKTGEEVPGLCMGEIARIVKECSSLSCTPGKLIGFKGVKKGSLEDNYLKQLRSRGFDRTKELDHLVKGGFQGYREEQLSVEKKKEEESGEEAQKKREEANARLRKSREEEIRELIEKGKREYEEFKEKQIMEDARRLLEIEWRSKYFSRGTTLQLEDYIAENLDRGKHDADRLVRMMRGERTIEDEENQMRDWEIEEMEKEEAEILAEEEKAAEAEAQAQAAE